MGAKDSTSRSLTAELVRTSSRSISARQFGHSLALWTGREDGASGVVGASDVDEVWIMYTPILQEVVKIVNYFQSKNLSVGASRQPILVNIPSLIIFLANSTAELWQGISHISWISLRVGMILCLVQYRRTIDTRCSVISLHLRVEFFIGLELSILICSTQFYSKSVTG